MMELINKMIISGCFIGITVSAADILKPSDKFAGHIRLVFAAVFLLVMFTPFINGSFSLKSELSESVSANAYVDDIEKGVNNEMKSIVEKNLSASLMEQLRQQNIFCREISVIVNIEDDYSIDISEVYVTGGYSKKTEEVIKNVLGKNVNVYEGEENEY